MPDIIAHPRTVRGSEVWAQDEPPSEMVWAICPYIRNNLKNCTHCPRYLEDEDHGQVQSGCYGFAAEACRVVFAMQRRAQQTAYEKLTAELGEKDHTNRGT